MNNLRQYLPDNWGLVLSAFAAAYGVGILNLLALPFLISAVMSDLKLDAAQAGFLMSAEFIFTMLASLIVAPAMGRAPRRTLAIAGAIVVIAANIISASITDVYVLAAIRCIAGVGAGLCLACGNASVSSAKDPDQAAGQMNFLFVGLMAIVMIAYADAMGSGGLAGLYYAIAITNILMLVLIFFMPQKAIIHANAPHFQHGGNHKNLFSTTAICMMAAMFLFSMRDTMGWAFVEQVGVTVGYSGEELGRLFSLQSVIGLIGPLAAAVIGKRFGMSTPVIIGILTTGAVSLGYVLGESSKQMYTIAVMMISTTYFYALAYLTALAAQLDSEGRIAAASGAFLTLGIAVGPAFTGVLAEAGGFTLVGWGIVGVVLLTLLAALVPLAAVRQQKAPATPAASVA
ncbi:MFS transporter [Pseudomonas sp. TTU2014-080ASC]|uniref:MFS transporter n=1 Tax=Pseudomonas sp. TTU2014-080ASC TaxID=1729724 RepID=UPI0007187803|nr:MFS transporter [Pseudomonas sp. TTU2014-080ASC]KRW58832.1 MFS transporter [Pseudomonas sp. TTU2014-080ASC]